LARQDPACERLMTVPGIGPIISSAVVAAIGNRAVVGVDIGKEVFHLVRLGTDGTIAFRRKMPIV
jgi:hypothetical protein